MTSAPPDQTTTLDPAEVDRFARMAAEWWDADGKFRPLHQIGPPRLAFIRDALTTHFGRDAGGLRPLVGLEVLDVGCGGGLVAEPMARMGGDVLGLDPARESIEAARLHATRQGLAPDGEPGRRLAYRCGTVEELADEQRRFDAVLCLEVIEHVPDVAAFLGVVARLLRPGGAMVLSTINRTVKSFALAIVGAEYVLRWLPAGTHQWERFVTPDELARHLRSAGLQPGASAGLVYDLLADRWRQSADLDVNYLLMATKAGEPSGSAMEATDTRLRSATA